VQISLKLIVDSQGSSSLQAVQSKRDDVAEACRELLLWGLVDDDAEIQKKIYG